MLNLSAFSFRRNFFFCRFTILFSWIFQNFTKIIFFVILSIRVNLQPCWCLFDTKDRQTDKENDLNCRCHVPCQGEEELLALKPDLNTYVLTSQATTPHKFRHKYIVYTCSTVKRLAEMKKSLYFYKWIYICYLHLSYFHGLIQHHIYLYVFTYCTLYHDIMFFASR